MKRKILAGIAILSFALIATLNSYGLHDLTKAGDPQGAGDSYPHIGVYDCGETMWKWVSQELMKGAMFLRISGIAVNGGCNSNLFGSI